MILLTLAVSQADPYVVLQLLTAPGISFKTRTVANSSRPVWNETFSFLIQSQVKVQVMPPTRGQAVPRAGRALGLEHTFPLGLEKRGVGVSGPCLDGCTGDRVWAQGPGPALQQVAGPLSGHPWDGDRKNALLTRVAVRLKITYSQYMQCPY